MQTRLVECEIDATALDVNTINDARHISMGITLTVMTSSLLFEAHMHMHAHIKYMHTLIAGLMQSSGWLQGQNYNNTVLKCGMITCTSYA